MLKKFRGNFFNLIKPEYQPTIREKLREMRFDQKTDELLNTARDLRDHRIAHAVPNAKAEGITFSDIRNLRDKLVKLLKTLSLRTTYVMYPTGYNNHHNADIDWILESIAKNSPLLNMPERDPQRWAYRKQNLSDENIRLLNRYRAKFGLPEV
jgi:hypothetical protein